MGEVASRDMGAYNPPTFGGVAMADRPHVLKQERVFAGRKIALEVHHVRDADGRETTREVVRHRGSVAILAFPEPGRVLLVRVWRYAVGREILELPAGTLEEGEDPQACAARELAEETGYRAARLELLMTLYPSPGVLSERLQVYLAEGLEPGVPNREPGEQMETVLLPVAEALAQVRDGRLTDAKTVAALLYWSAFRSRRAASGGGGA
jgi:ADP-ribose pyrophosphatase